MKSFTIFVVLVSRGYSIQFPAKSIQTSSTQVGRRGACSWALGMAGGSLMKGSPARAEKLYELGPLVLRTEDDPSINPTVLEPSALAIDPSVSLPAVTDRVFMKLSMDGKPVGVINFELFGKVAPKTVENFVSLCRGDGGRSYAGSSVFRVIPGLNIGFGDVGGGGDRCVKAGTCISAKGGPIRVENFDLLHSEIYFVYSSFTSSLGHYFVL